ncbi:hypothetical protein PCC7418_1391 [Halothece sp. PCC 7418]|uniref:hypothetical protein n=1 Tax=Halothece sp. (strain PCC 7418) TaxID=65093 RepID=UPI0002A071CA|nr:hypothetical protein [Halothece sp. PCC 7418]AFZ43587.1 hypothetical protein PCC7418_1391 [Halothece sp. PCC 7418]
MSDLETIIKQSINPFDTANFKKGNFWEEEQPEDLNINSIHQDILETVEKTLKQIYQDKKSRTIRLEGDSGSGKTHLLGRIKKSLNRKAFFAHIIASIQTEYICQYTLRKTIESLMFIPEGETESQLLLWLKRIINQQSGIISQKILGKKKTFINNMKAAYPSGIWKPNSFFSVLYALTQPDLYYLACGWLKGDDLDDEDLTSLGVKVTIQTEDDAMNMLTNFSRISKSTLPIVLCFDEIDISHNRQDLLESILKLNMIIHSQKLKNFLVILSVITDTWKKYEDSLTGSLKAPINQTLSLKPITTEQIEALWSIHLRPLHQQLQKLPESRIAPLNRKDLKSYFPSGKADPRNALKAGHELIQYYKTGRVDPPDSIAAFQLVWREELKIIQEKINTIYEFSSAELAKMLQESIEVFDYQTQFNIFNKKSSFAVKSFIYNRNSDQKNALIWYDQPNLGSFCSLMKALDDLSQSKIYEKIILIRSQSMGKPQNQGYKLFQKIFQNSLNLHLKPDLNSIHILATYHRLYSFTTNQNLTIGYETPDIKRLQELTRESAVFNDCQLLNQLEILESQESDPSKVTPPQPQLQLKEYILNLVKTTSLIGRQALTDKVITEFKDQTTAADINLCLETLINEKEILIVNPNLKIEAQIISINSSKKRK